VRFGSASGILCDYEWRLGSQHDWHQDSTNLHPNHVEPESTFRGWVETLPDALGAFWLQFVEPKTNDTVKCKYLSQLT